MSDSPMFLHTEIDSFTQLHHLRCNACGKRCSSGFVPTVTEMGKHLIVRAWVECPECIEAKAKRDNDE